VVELRVGQRGDAATRSPHRIPCELTERPFVRGSVGMRISGRDTAQGDLFITLLRRPERDGRYTQLARVISGMKIVERLLPGDMIKRAEVGR
jgi:cyclophilin family peptidyl-prolyl cis-trans isomerase